MISGCFLIYLFFVNSFHNVFWYLAFFTYSNALKLNITQCVIIPKSLLWIWVASSEPPTPCAVSIASTCAALPIHQWKSTLTFIWLFFSTVGSLCKDWLTSQSIFVFITSSNLALSANYATSFPFSKFIINILSSTYPWEISVVISLLKLPIYSCLLIILHSWEDTDIPFPSPPGPWAAPLQPKVTLHRTCSVGLVVLGAICSSGSNSLCDFRQSFMVFCFCFLCPLRRDLLLKPNSTYSKEYSIVNIGRKLSSMKEKLTQTQVTFNLQVYFLKNCLVNNAFSAHGLVSGQVKLALLKWQQ